MAQAIISGSGLLTPEFGVTNAELVAAQAHAAEAYNERHAAEIAAGELEERVPSSDAFIMKASGIKHRYFVDRRGVLDPSRLRPILPLRREDEHSIQCEMSLRAIREALGQAGRSGSDVDAVIVACSNLQRPYPAVAVEVQAALGAGGWAYDLNVACSSATFGIQNAVNAITCGNARCAVVVNPEITSGHNNFELRDSHFIFGDACTAVVVEARERFSAATGFEVLGCELATLYSNNIRNDFGFLNRCEEDPAGPRPAHDLLFRQNGRKVFREVCPLVVEHIQRHLERKSLAPADIAQFWLHQANRGMNQIIAKNLLGRDATPAEAPTILDEYGNTSSAGSVIAFHKYKDALAVGELGVLCSFGAGYSIGSVIVRKIAS